LVGNIGSYAKDSMHFVNKIKNLKMENKDILLSFDVVSLSTIILINERVVLTEKLIDLRIDKLVELCLGSTFLFPEV
jgi:hypothetical protein